MSSETNKEAAIASLRELLCSESTPLYLRIRALTSLRFLAKHETGNASDAAIEAIVAAFVSPSALLKHELAYCLGQSGKLAAVKPLLEVLDNLQEDPMCRHEAAEALGALGDESYREILEKYRVREDEDVVVKETCEIAIARLNWAKSGENLHQSRFESIDPAPPTPESSQSIEYLKKALMDTNASLFFRYRVMFRLRDLVLDFDPQTALIAESADPDKADSAIKALAEGFKDRSSALFRHEIAFVFGQLSHPASIDALKAVLEDLKEASMVRHEAAEALGSLGGVGDVKDTLRRFLHDKDTVVRESVIVALDMIDFEESHEAEYALIPEASKVAV